MSADDHGNREARRRFAGDDHAVPHHEKTAEAGYLCEIMQRTRSRRGVYFRIDERLTPRRRLRGIKRIRFLQHTGLFPIVPQKTDFSFFVCFRRPLPPSPRRVVIKSLQIFQRFAAEQVNMQMVHRLSRVVALIDHHAIAVFKAQLVFQLRDF